MKKILITAVTCLIFVIAGWLFLTYNPKVASKLLAEIYPPEHATVAEYVEEQSEYENTHYAYFDADGNEYCEFDAHPEKNSLKLRTAKYLLRKIQPNIRVIHRYNGEDLMITDIANAPLTGKRGILILNNSHCCFYLAAKDEWPEEKEILYYCKAITYDIEVMRRGGRVESELAAKNYLLQQLADKLDLIYWYLPNYEHQTAEIIGRIRELQEKGHIDW